MSKKIVLNVEKREKIGRSSHLSKTTIPAVVYGFGMENEVISVNKVDFKRVFAQTGKSSVLELKVEGDKAINVLVHDLQYHPVSGEIAHMDFLQVNMKEVVEAEISLVFVNDAPAVKEKGGTLVKVIDKVSVEALPDDLPSEIEIDLSKIVDFEDHIAIKDIKVSDKVKLLMDEEVIVALVTPPRTEAELEEVNEKVEVDVSKVAVTKKEKSEKIEEKK
jgi:large subunit ribosomal protein L25